LYSGLAGAMAGASSVVITMPQDTVKSRMQSETSKEMYSSTLDCFQKILKTEGFATLFSGTIPSLVRVSLDVGKHSTPSHH
jgi:solute carrier family 25 (mitochondrial citrate transporter), member 1